MFSQLSLSVSYSFQCVLAQKVFRIERIHQPTNIYTEKSIKKPNEFGKQKIIRMPVNYLLWLICCYIYLYMYLVLCSSCRYNSFEIPYLVTHNKQAGQAGKQLCQWHQHQPLLLNKKKRCCCRTADHREAKEMKKGRLLKVS